MPKTPRFGGVSLLLMLLLALAGCVTTSERQPYTLNELLSSQVNGEAIVRYFPGRDPDIMEVLGWTSRLPEMEGPRFDILALSSGGPDGSYGAGALNGMSKAGNRPEYEVITGTSTGALIAPFAFVGQRADSQLKELYTGEVLKSVLGRPNILAAASGPALFPARGIPQLMAQYIDEDLLARVADEHRKGRRLLIATANLDADELTIWNMGRIASIGGPHALGLFRDVLRAAIAIPGALSPVEIVSRSGDRSISELHGDAGVLSYFYADPDLVPSGMRRGGEAMPRIDIILHNQIDTPIRPAEPRSLKLAGRSVSTLTRTSMRLLLKETQGDASSAGIAVRFAHIPRAWRTVSALEFDRDYMRETFSLGYRNAIEGELWKTGSNEN